jgi:hypothetical protein
MRSIPPPAGQFTTNVIGLLGKVSSACLPHALSITVSAATVMTIIAAELRNPAAKDISWFLSIPMLLLTYDRKFEAADAVNMFVLQAGLNKANSWVQKKYMIRTRWYATIKHCDS